MRRFAPLALVWTLVALALGVAAAGAETNPLPDGPALSTMALGPNDFAAARVAGQGHVDSEGAVAAYVREFAPGARAVRSALLAASNEVALLADETAAREVTSSVRAALASPAGRAALGNSFRSSFTRSSKLKIISLAVSRPTTLGIGADAFRFAITFKTRVGRFHLVFAFVRVDRAIGQILLLGRQGKIIAAGDLKRLAAAQRDRFRKAFTITTGQVVLAGTLYGETAKRGSTLTANHTGRFDGGPSEYAYQWSRCDPTGACTPIEGATSATYAPTEADVDRRVKVTVTARNSVSSITVESATALVYY
jgi:hypothetical protein